MQLKMFSICDTKAGFYNQPFFQHSRLEAERSFMSLAYDSNSTISKYPEDYDLYYLGEYDNITGKITALSTPEHIIKAANLPNPRPLSQTV